MVATVTRMPLSGGRGRMQMMSHQRNIHRHRGAAEAAGTRAEIVAEGGMGRGAGTPNKACTPSVPIAVM